MPPQSSLEEALAYILKGGEAFFSYFIYVYRRFRVRKGPEKVAKNCKKLQKNAINFEIFQESRRFVLEIAGKYIKTRAFLVHRSLFLVGR